MVVILTDVLSQSLGTLSAATALIVGNAYDNSELTERGFLLKKTIVHGVQVQDLTAGEGPILFGCGRGDLTAGLITDAVDEAQKIPDTEVQGKVQKIFRESMRYVPSVVDSQGPISYTIKWGGGKGIPAMVEKGFNWWVINRDGSDLTTGAVLHAEMTHYGVWL